MGATVTVTNLIQGPATLWYGSWAAGVGPAEPLDSQINSSPAASAWTETGATDGGLTIVVNQTYSMLDVDQIVDHADARITTRLTQMTTSLAEATFKNLALALNGGTVATGAQNTYAPDNTQPGGTPNYAAFLIDGWSPGGFRRRVFLRKALQTASVSSKYEKGGKFMIPVTFDCFYVSSTVTPYRIVDGTT